MQRAGFQCLAAIDFNEQAVATLRSNFPHLGTDRARHEDLTSFRPERLAEIIGTEHVDVIVGGPPCQGFSTARQVDGANHGDRLKVDPRRQLFRELLRYVEFFQPRVFVMENVLGLRTAAGGEYFTAVQHEARQLGQAQGRPGYRVHGQVEDAYALGVPQKRQRQLIIGVRNDLPGYFPPDLRAAKRARTGTNLGAAIGDLPPIPAGDGDETRDYDRWWRRNALAQFGAAGRNYLFKVLEVRRARQLTAHRARPHSDRDLRDFALLREGESSAQAMRRGVTFEFPYDKTTFKDRYTRQSRYAPCSTIVAHLSKDGLMFIHPWQNRSLTPREAARVQSFPDWFQFPVARTHQFRLIGNAVPPLVSEAVGDAIRTFLRGLRVAPQQLPLPLPGETRRPAIRRPRYDLPTDLAEAHQRLRVLANATPRELRSLSSADFRRGWHALLFAFPELHPDNALPDAHGTARFQAAAPPAEAADWRERYQRSGWPVALVLIGVEAWRRHEAGELSEGVLYCVAAQRAGLAVRREAAAMA
jgi:DNA (cytosine-5)-methyltransferase 1